MGSKVVIWAMGIAVIAYGAGAWAVGTLPGAADSGDQLVAWFRENQGGVRWSVWMSTIAGPLLATALAILRSRLPAPHRDVFWAGGLGIVVTLAVQSWTWAGLALHPDRLDPATARTVLDVAIFWGPVLTGATITMMAPVTLLALRGRAGLPRWLGALGAAAIAEQAIETVTIFGTSGFTEPGGAMNLQLGAGLVNAWMLGFAIWAGLRSAPAPGAEIA